MRSDVPLATDYSRALDLAEVLRTVATRHDTGDGGLVSTISSVAALAGSSHAVGLTALEPVLRAMADSRRHFADAATAVGVRVVLAADGTLEADI